jgi:hypothetical protein
VRQSFENLTSENNIMVFDPSWHVGRGAVQPVEEEKHVALSNLTLEQFDGFASKASKSNADKHAEAVSDADAHAWLAANSWYKFTKTNNKLVDNWLKQQGIKDPLYADYDAAASELANTGLLDIDEASRAQFLDNGPKGPFKGFYTKRTFTDLDTYLAQERQAAIEQQAADKPTDIERALNALPIEDFQATVKNAVRSHQVIADGKISQQNADSWISLHPEYRDDAANGKLLLAQLRLNGVVNRPVTIEDYEIANRQLVESGMVRQNPAQLRKQEEQAVLDRAQAAVNTPGSVFDKTTENEMYELPLDELRRRANGNFTGSDRF